jgi:LuxR family maltose regulon positive regulatory protein
MALLYPDYLKECRKDFPSLTETEREVLQLMANERTNSEIAYFMGISINTVKFHSKNIYEKLSVNNRRRAVKVAKENNIL